MTMSDRLAVMRHGRIEQIGAPQDVYERPSTEFVAGFLGASNLLEGEVQAQRNGHASIRLKDGNAVAVPNALTSGQAGSKVLLGVRPEKIRLEPDGFEPGEGTNFVTGILRVSTYVGVSHQYTVDGPDGRTLTVYEQNVKGGSAVAPGERVRLVWQPEHTFVVEPSEPLADWEEET
jgi:spermidine/putrescine transport system ATP-binding protein